VNFRIQPTPAAEEFGGPADDDPDNFIDLNLAGLSAEWLYDGDLFFVVFEDELPPTAEDSLVVLLRELGSRHGVVVTKDQFVSSSTASHGIVFFQERGTDIMHIEYLSHLLPGAVGCSGNTSTT